MSRIIRIVAGAAVGLALGSLAAGCGGGDTANTAAAAKPPTGPGNYQFTYQGASVTVAVPADPDAPEVADLEAYRETVGAPPVTYLLADVDNTKGRSDINMYRVDVVEKDGSQVSATSLDDTITAWQDRLPGSATADYNVGIDLINANHFFALPGAKDTAVLVADQPIVSPQRVFVYPAGGIDRVEAHRPIP